MVTTSFTQETQATESETYPSPEQLQEINEKMEEMRNEINNRLENGETDIETSRTLSFSDEPITMGVNMEDAIAENNTDTFTTFAAGTERKTYSAYVNNTAGFNFGHSVNGSFTYQTGMYINQVTNVSRSVSLTGFWYGKTHITNVQNETADGTMKRLSSRGTFTALKYAPIQYQTNITIIFQPGSYRITQAFIS